MTIKIGGHGREEHASAIIGGIKKVTDSNQLRLQTLELAVAHLTNICIGLSEDVRSLRSILLDSNRIQGQDKAAVIEMKLPYYSTSNSSSLSSDSKDDLGFKKVKRQPWKKDARVIPVIKVQGIRQQAIKDRANPKAAVKTSQKGSTGSTKSGFVKSMTSTKLKPPMVTNSVKESAKLKTESKRILQTFTREGIKKPAYKAEAKSVPLNVKGGGRTSGSGGNGVTVKLSPQMADAPTIRSLIYGSRNASVIKSRN